MTPKVTYHPKSKLTVVDITSNLPTVIMACGVSGSGKSYTMVDLVVRWVQGQIAAPTGRLLYITIGALEYHKGNNGKGIERDMIEAIQKDSSVDRGSDGKRCTFRNRLALIIRQSPA